MNERIRLLALQAGMHRDKFGMYFAGGDSHNEDGVDLEKFAELIVAECTRIVINHGIATATHDQMVRQDCAKAIKQHFRVEE